VATYKLKLCIVKRKQKLRVQRMTAIPVRTHWSYATGERNMPSRADARALAPGTPGTTTKSKRAAREAVTA